MENSKLQTGKKHNHITYHSHLYQMSKVWCGEVRFGEVGWGKVGYGWVRLGKVW